MSVDVPLYLLDEPVAELDLTTIDRFHALVSRKRERGKTVVISSHTPADIEIADRLVFVRAGRIVTGGPPEVLLDTVPPVVNVAGHTNTEAIRPHVRERRLFESDTGRRGFLSDGAAPETVEQIDDSIGIEHPTWTDLFNYYVHAVPEKR